MPYGTINAESLVSSTGGILSADSSVFRNRIINGGMVIDQRNAGASSTAAGYSVDRFAIAPQAAGYITWGQNLGSVTPPNGFVNYLGFSTTTTYSIGAGDSFRCEHLIEGYNVADLGWGAANAQPITISFWTRSSLTGTHAATLQNSARSRSYPFTWTINVANTWEYKTVTIAGDTSGTWLTTNGIGIRINFNLGCGATGSGTAGSWSSSNFVSATGAVSVVGTLNANLYITGVQLEKGSTATSFDYRPFGTELALCQRYFERSYNIGSATGSFTNGFSGFVTSTTSATDITPNLRYAVTKRDTPTVVVYNAVSGASGAAYRTSDAASISVSGINYSGTTGVGTFTLASGSINNYLIHWTASSEL
jgi:hypothetical protein